MTRPKITWLHPSIALLVMAALVMAACGDDDKKFDVSQYTGTYSGTWTNATSGQSGPVTIAISADEKARTASLTLDFGGNYLGLGDPPPAMIQGVFDDQRATVKGTSELFGDYNVVIEADGAITGLMQNLAGGLVPKLSYTGTLTKSTLDADYLVTLKDGSTSTATLRMTKD